MDKYLQPCAAALIGALCFVTPNAPAFAAPPSAKSSDSKPSPVWLEFDSGMLDADAQARLREQLSAKLASILAQADMHLVDSASLARRTILVRVISFDAARRDFEVLIELREKDETLAWPVVRCDACNEVRLVSLVADGTMSLIELEKELAHAEAPPECPPPVLAPSASNGEPMKSTPRARLTNLGTVGATLILPGALGVAGGVYFMLIREKHENEKVVAPTIATGPSLIVAGAVTAGIGATLLAIDLKRQKKRRNLSFQVTRTYVGLNLMQRF